MSDKDYDWFRFWVHFAFGALLGAVMGLVFWMQSWHPGLPLWLWVGGFSLGIALVGGTYGDRFWGWLLSNLRWW